MRQILAFLFCLWLASPLWIAGAQSQTKTTVELTHGVFVPIKIGGGGFVTYFEIAPDGSMVSQSDSAGPWGKSSHTQDWSPINTARSMPIGDYADGGGNPTGHYNPACAISIAPSNSSLIYMYLTLNQGTTYIYKATGGISGLISGSSKWAHTSGAFSASCEPNGAGRLLHPKLAISPQDPGTVYVGTPSNGIYYTTNGGASWTQLPTSTVPGAGGGYNLVVFDPSDGTGNTVFVSSNGHGIWKCTAARLSPSCSELNSTGMPTGFTTIYVDQAGTLWVVDSGNNLWRYLSAAWLKTIAKGGNGTQINAITVNPANSNQAVAVDTSGCLTYTTSAQGAKPSWTQSFGGGACNGAYPPTAFSYASTKIPWIQWANDSTIASVHVQFDPTQSNVLYSGGGVGFYKTPIPWIGTAKAVWSADETAGIENLDLVSGSPLTGGGLTFTAQDRPNWIITDFSSYPSQYGPGQTRNPNPVVANFTYGCSDGSQQFAILSVSGYSESTTNGAAGTWLGYVNPSTRNIYGNCVFINSTTRIWLSSQDVGPYISTNNGASWSPCTFGRAVGGGAVTSGGGGFLASQFILPETRLAQDGTEASTVLVHNDGTGGSNGSAAAGYWISTVGCAFKQQSNVSKTGPYSSILKSVPGQHCNYFTSITNNFHGASPSGDQLFISRDCGMTWTAVANVESFYNWTFGAPKPGSNGYPTFYCSCWHNDGVHGFIYGIWEANNINTRSPTWTNINSTDKGFPSGNADHILFMVGDLATYGTVYIGFGGSGGAYRTLNFLQKRDLDPAGNDDTPVGINRAG